MYNLQFNEESFGGHVPFVDTDHLRFIRGGLTIDAEQVQDNFALLQAAGAADLVNGKLTLFAGAFLGLNEGTGLYEAFVPPVTPVAASVTVGGAGANQQVLIEADTEGAAGNEIGVVLIDPGANDQELHVTYDGNIIICSLATGAAGAITTTANDLLAAINAAAGADVTASAVGTGALEVEAQALTYLSGGIDGNLAIAAGLKTGLGEVETQINWRATVPGAAANAVTIEYIDPLAANQALAVAENGGNIEVSLATDADGNVITTAAELVEEALTVGAVTAIAVPELACAVGDGVVQSMEATTMSGGVDAGDANISGRYACILFEDVDLQNGNAVATGIDHGRVIAARLPIAPTADVIAALPGVVFK